MKYYYADESYQAQGPVSAEQLHDLHRQGTIKANTSIAAEGATEWTPYHNINPAAQQTRSTMFPPLAGANVFPQQHQNQQPPHVTKGSKGLTMTSWILLVGTCFLSLIPFLGFATWFIAGPVLIATLVLGIITLTRGATLQGIMILAATLLVVPMFILIAPLATTAIIGAAANSSNQKSTEDSGTPAPTSSQPINDSNSPATKQPQNYSIGQTVAFRDSEWVVTEASDLGSTLPGGTFSKDKRSSGKFVHVVFNVTNRTNEEETIVETPKLVDVRNRKFNQLDDVSFYLPEGAEEMTLEQLPSGITKTFHAIFEVPGDATQLSFQARSLGFNPQYTLVSLGF